MQADCTIVKTILVMLSVPAVFGALGALNLALCGREKWALAVGAPSYAILIIVAGMAEAAP